ncbi:FtsK/SpoIIIE family DNA translocase [Thiovibrio frasassiensis]|uniref:DNA translocase FtsK n=1 Tax=Thiovibrio frasassiensis TaxID=2984131 RepID=A0A9X4RM41_9BACT|nr:DNA translocase FtsK [Thiovibrio frasassiensis]MDG4476409.1 DNA translocase FtsK [Thiovibrio frasassiensis]
MAKGNNQQEKPTLGREILSVFGVFAALFLLLCLLSHTTPDPSGQILASNWGGAVGQFVAGLLMDLLGITAFWLPFLLLFFSIRIFSPDFTLETLPLTVFGCTGILLASAGLSGFTSLASFTVFAHTYPVAGFLGTLLAQYGQLLFGGPGSFLLFLVVLLISLMLISSFSPYSLGNRLRAFVLSRWTSRQAAEANNSAGQGKKGEVAASAAAASPSADDSIVPKVHAPVKLEVGAEDDSFRLLPAASGEYRLPPLSLLDKPGNTEVVVDREYYYAVSAELEEKLNDFGVVGKVVGISPGPVITTYEFSPAPGVKINKIIALADDLALGLKAESVRIVGSIPGKAALGIEIPNPTRNIVYVRDIFAHEKFQKAASRLTIGLGMDVVGNPVIADLARMPHLLIAGATGSGKSVAVNTIICSILFRATPEEVRLLLVDPKRIELSCYEDIPHLLHPVVVDPKLASRALLWAVREMERRYQLMEEAKVKSLASYNAEAAEKLPLIVIIIDELADLMMVSSREVEDSVARLAQMARAAGMHLILATQRPSVDVLTGLIKANFPTRMSFKVSSKIDSRTILDGSGAEHLLGAGDMLFMPPGTSKLQRIHGAYISDKETERIVTFLKEQGAVRYDESVLKLAEEAEAGEGDEGGELDEKYDEAVALVCESGQASISMVQRRLRVGYNRAARMIELMEKEGVVGPADGSKPREVLARKSY